LTGRIPVPHRSYSREARVVFLLSTGRIPVKHPFPMLKSHPKEPHIALARWPCRTV